MSSVSLNEVSLYLNIPKQDTQLGISQFFKEGNKKLVIHLLNQNINNSTLEEVYMTVSNNENQNENEDILSKVIATSQVDFSYRFPLQQQ